MKKIILFLSWILITPTIYAQNSNDYLETTVTFAKDYKIGDYIEFASAKAGGGGSSGYYEISINYTRINIAASATHLASSGHRNHWGWREAGRINNNVYTQNGVNFTVDHNPSSRSFRIRAINTLGGSAPLPVHVKIRSINQNFSFISLNNHGNEAAPVPLLPMTYDWSLIVGNTYNDTPGILAIKAISNGNVGIGTSQPTQKLSVKGKIRAQEIIVDAGPWPDYVFEEDYSLTPLDSLEQFIKTNKHLPNISTSLVVEKEGIELGELNKQLLQKIEEITLYLIHQQKDIRDLKSEIQSLKNK